MKRMYISHRLAKGLTLIELVLYMGLLSIFLMILVRLFSSTIDVQLESEAYSHVEQDGRYLLSRLAHDVGRASAIVTPPTLGSPSGTLQLTVDSINYSYTVTNGSLTLAAGTSTDALNSVDTSVSNFVVRRLGNNVNGKNSLQVAFTLQSRAQRSSGPETKTFQTTLGLR
jgi:type II secretory pathway pseudopilin PulG